MIRIDDIYNFVYDYNTVNMIFLVSGKRAVGKDTFCKLLHNYLNNNTTNCINKVTALADAPKYAFCKKYGIDYNRFMIDRKFKETHRVDFIDFAENAKDKDKYIWCKEAMKDCEHLDNIIISDLRYPVELEFFMKYFSNQIVTIRINASDEIRTKRGWTYSKNVDEHVSENGLDDIDFDYYIDNDYNDGNKNLLKQIEQLSS